MRVKNKVEQLLQTRPELRSSDRKLLLSLWESEGLQLNEIQKRTFLERCTTPESITRARRALRAKYPGTEEVEQERFNQMLEYREDYLWSQRDC